MKFRKIRFNDAVEGEEGLLKGPFGSDLKKSLYVPKGVDTYKVYLQENILKRDISKGKHYISKNYFDNNMHRYEVKEGDFIVTCDGTLGEIFQLKGLKEKGIISSSLLRITLNPQVINNDYFLYLWQQRIKYPLIRSHENSVLKHLPGLNTIRNFEFEIPELITQQKIASVLSALDSKIELNNRINAELEAMAKTIYDYWFVQFDFPDKNGKPYKSSGGKMVWNEELKREIPEGWEVKTVKDLMLRYSDQSNSIESKQILSHGKYPVITQDNGEFISGYTNNENPIKDIPLIIFGDHSCTLRYVDFLFFRGADGTQIIRFNDEMMFYMFLFLQKVIHQLPGYGKYERHFKYLKEFYVLIPSFDNIKSFSSVIKPMFDKISKSRFENQQLTSLRDWLLPMLMNGQVKVS